MIFRYQYLRNLIADYIVGVACVPIRCGLKSERAGVGADRACMRGLHVRQEAISYVASSGAFPPQRCGNFMRCALTRPCLRNAALSKFTVTQMLPQLAAPVKAATAGRPVMTPASRPPSLLLPLDPRLTCSGERTEVSQSGSADAAGAAGGRYWKSASIQVSDRQVARTEDVERVVGGSR